MYSGIDTSMITRLKELKAESSHLKKIYANEPLKAMVAQEVLTKKVLRLSLRNEMTE